MVKKSKKQGAKIKFVNLHREFSLYENEIISLFKKTASKGNYVLGDELNEFETETGLKIFTDKDINPSGDLDNFAAQVASMDLVITISNTTAHMAGALGVPIWNILPTGPGRLWYWFLSGSTSPWYKSMRLFRHAYNEGWKTLAALIAERGWVRSGLGRMVIVNSSSPI